MEIVDATVILRAFKLVEALNYAVDHGPVYEVIG